MTLESDIRYIYLYNEKSLAIATYQAVGYDLSVTKYEN